MTDAPERIWAFPKKDWFNAGASTKRITTAGARDVCYVRKDLHDAQAARIADLVGELQSERSAKWRIIESPLTHRIAELEAVLRETLIEVDKLGNHCVGCGHMCGDPEKDLAMIRKAGGISCCPERKMEPISTTLAAMVPALTTLKGTTDDT